MSISEGPKGHSLLFNGGDFSSIRADQKGGILASDVSAPTVMNTIKTFFAIRFGGCEELKLKDNSGQTRTFLVKKDVFEEFAMKNGHVHKGLSHQTIAEDMQQRMNEWQTKIKERQIRTTPDVSPQISPVRTSPTTSSSGSKSNSPEETVKPTVSWVQGKELTKIADVPDRVNSLLADCLTELEAIDSLDEKEVATHYSNQFTPDSAKEALNQILGSRWDGNDLADQKLKSLITKEHTYDTQAQAFFLALMDKAGYSRPSGYENR